jgi:hypothetical protein
MTPKVLVVEGGVLLITKKEIFFVIDPAKA